MNYTGMKAVGPDFMSIPFEIHFLPLEPKAEERLETASSPNSASRKKKAASPSSTSPNANEKSTENSSSPSSSPDSHKKGSNKLSKATSTKSSISVIPSVVSTSDSTPSASDSASSPKGSRSKVSAEGVSIDARKTQNTNKTELTAVNDSVAQPSSTNEPSTTTPTVSSPTTADTATAELPKPETSSSCDISTPVAASAAKMAPRASIVVQRRRNNPLQKPVGWNFAPGDSLDPKVHSKHAKRQNIALEISSTENSYISTLKHLYDAFVLPCQLVTTSENVSTMFGNLFEILQLHQEFAREITERVSHWNYSSTISDIFLQYIPRMKIYSSFINTYDKGQVLIAELSANKSSKFVELLNVFSALSATHGLDMNAFRISPVQRLPRLCLLLEDLLRNTIERHPDYTGVKESLAKLKEVSLAVNAAKGAAIMQEHFESISKRLTGWSNGTAKACKSPLMNELRHLVIEDTPMMLYGPTRAQPVYLALFNDGVLIAKRSDESKSESKNSDLKSDPKAKSLEFLDWILVRDISLRKIGTKQVTKIAKDWKVQLEFDDYHWLELQVDEKETFMLGVTELKPWHDWPSKFRATKENLRSKYWSVLNSVNQNSPPPCAYGTLTYYASTSTFIYFGGISNKLLNAFFSYDLRTRMWVSITSIGGPPPALAKHSANLVGTKIWFYGGLVKNTVTVSNEWYTYDVPSNTWSGPIATNGDVPTRGRAGHTMVTVGSKLYLVGGASFDDKKQEVILDEMFEFDTETKKWTALNKAPLARHGHVAAALDGKLYVWGGRSPGGEYASVVSVYDFAVRDWADVPPNLSGFIPNPRQWASGVPVQGRHLLVMGGKRDVLHNDIYLLDVNAETWCRYSIPCVLEHRMSGSIQVVENPKSGIISVFVFGGLQLNAETMDTTVYSDQFITFQLHNKYIQQTAKPPIWTNLRAFAVDNAPGSILSSSSSAARFNFVSKSSNSQGAVVTKAESQSALCTLQRSLASDSRFGEMWLGEHARTHLAFAVKVMKKPVQRDTSEDWKQLVRSVEIAQKCKSTFLASLLGIMDQPATESFWILSEYCKYGSVKDYLAAGNKLREPQLQFLASVMISALQALHAAGLTHGNLKASNLLLTDGLEFKVSDFALTQALETLLKPTSAWNAWDAPEVLLGGSPTPKSDAFALGVTIIELAEFAPPHKTLKKRWSSNMEDFVHKATMESEKLRADMESLANHPWIRSAKTSEKLQLDLADMIKKVFSKESKKRTATLAASPAVPLSPSSSTSSLQSSSSSQNLNLSGSLLASSAVPSSPSGTPSSGRSSRDKKNSAEGLNSSASDEAPDASAEVETLKARNAVLRKKLRLLKKAYAELSQENSKLKDLLDQSSLAASGDTEDSTELPSPHADQPQDRSSSPSSGKIKRQPKAVTTPKEKDKASRRSLKITDASSPKVE